MSNLKEKYNDVYKKGKDNFHSVVLKDIYDEVFSFIQDDVSGKNVLDLGCGDGEITEKYLKGASHVVGIDYSKEAIKIAKNKFIVNANFDCISFIDYLNLKDFKYDIVVCIGVIEHCDDPEIIFQIANKVLRKNGLLILEHPHFENLRGVIWKCLEIFCDAKMSLTDKHTIKPKDIYILAGDNGFEIEESKTFMHSRANGEDLIIDYDKRLRLAPGYKFEIDLKVDAFIRYLREVAYSEIFPSTKFNGAEILWRIKKK